MCLDWEPAPGCLCQHEKATGRELAPKSGQEQPPFVRKQMLKDGIEINHIEITAERIQLGWGLHVNDVSPFAIDIRQA